MCVQACAQARTHTRNIAYYMVANMAMLARLHECVYSFITQGSPEIYCFGEQYSLLTFY
jgi:hypothetical protein